MGDDSDKTEDPTPFRLEEAREKGDVAQSRDFANFFVFLGFGLALYFSGKTLIKGLANSFRRYFDLNSFPVETPVDVLNVVSFVIKDILWMLAPLFASLMFFGIAAYVSQFGFLFTLEKISPNFGKLNPISGFARIFSRETAMEFVKSTIKLVVAVFIFYLIFKGEFERLNQLGAQPLAQSFTYFTDLIGSLILSMLMFMAVLGVLDLGWQKWSYVQRMKMSWNEVKQETKNREGDPHIKARIRQIQRDQARRRMMDDVPKADVVVTNPTHVAVALRYKRGETKAPIVVAKGAGYIALKIKEIAVESGVPVIEKKQLARYLYRNTEVGDLVPESLYTAVAEVLAYVYRVKKKLGQLMSAKGGQAAHA